MENVEFKITGGNTDVIIRHDGEVLAYSTKITTQTLEKSSQGVNIESGYLEYLGCSRASFTKLTKLFRNGSEFDIDLYSTKEDGVSFYHTNAVITSITTYDHNEMISISFIRTIQEPKYRVGRKQKKVVLDEKGREVLHMVHGGDSMCRKICDFLNKN